MTTPFTIQTSSKRGGVRFRIKTFRWRGHWGERPQKWGRRGVFVCLFKSRSQNAARKSGKGFVWNEPLFLVHFRLAIKSRGWLLWRPFLRELRFLWTTEGKARSLPFIAPHMQRAFCSIIETSHNDRNRVGLWGVIRGHPFITFAKFSGFLTTSSPCLQSGLIYSTKFTQPPFLHSHFGLFFYSPLPLSARVINGSSLRTRCISITDLSPLVSVMFVSSILDESSKFLGQKKTTQMKVYYYEMHGWI